MQQMALVALARGPNFWVWALGETGGVLQQYGQRDKISILPIGDLYPSISGQLFIDSFEYLDGRPMENQSRLKISTTASLGCIQDFLADKGRK